MFMQLKQEKFFSLSHFYHLVFERPWPLLVSGGVLVLVIGLVEWLNCGVVHILRLGVILILACSFQWWRDVVREGFSLGRHTRGVLLGLKGGMMLFIISEVLFFFSFFWTFFHSRLSSCVELGKAWPPVSIERVDFLGLPFLNTCILLCSGLSVTIRHHRIINKNLGRGITSLLVTIFLGVYFLLAQGFEFFVAGFSISDSVFGSIFFLTTGFHGRHVFVGVIMLLFSFFRLLRKEYSSDRFFGFERARWYWHFVDVVWLFLFVFYYWWGA